MRRPKAAIVACAAVALMASIAGAADASGSADPTLNFTFAVNAKTHVAKLNKDITVPTGSFVGAIDLSTGKLVGQLTLPPAQTSVDLLGLPAANAGFAIVPVGPVRGQVNLSNFQVTATAVFNARIPYVYPLGVSVNLVGSGCQTSQPISITFTGNISPSGSHFSSSYTIPDFDNCQLATLPINLLIPGSGNTFTATFTPAPHPAG